MSKDLETLAGGQIMIGIPGPEMTSALRAHVRRIRPGGVIFFRPNFSSPKDFQKLVHGLEEAAGHKLILAVDHEGGRVIHIPFGATVFPDNLVIGNTKKIRYASLQGKIEARELKKLGLTLNLAPTVDVLRENFSPNIGIRSYGKDSKLVSAFGAARIKAMQAGGISACAKHFPGQGHSTRDAHLDLPVLSSPLKEVEKIHLAPFRAAIKAGVRAVMSSHPIYPGLDSKKQPATFSKAIITGMLRKGLGFKGAILSDDLEMGALKGICPIGESAVRAIEAGHDMVLVCHNLKAQALVFESLVKAYASGRLDRWNLEKSLVRLDGLKQTGTPAGGIFPAKNLVSGMTRAGVRRSLKHAEFGFKKGDTVSAVFPRLSKMAGKIMIEKEMLDEKNFLKKVLREKGWKPGRLAFAGDEVPGDAVFFCYDAHLDTATRRQLESFQKKRGRRAVVLLRDPYDIDFVKKNAACVSAFGFRAAQIRAALDLLVKK